MPFADLVEIVVMALLCALVVGAAGLVALRLLRRRALLIQLCVVVLASLGSLAAGVIAVAQAMYLSEHDFLVVVVVTVVSTVVSLAVAVILGVRLTKAARHLSELTHAVGDGERVGAESTPPAAEFQRLAADLADTSERLAAAREEVAEIDASRRDLMAWISHDLRSPLSGLRAMTEALDDGLAEDPARFHHQMRLQVDHLTDLVDDLFELSKISSGRLTLTMEELSLHDLVSDAAAELAAVARMSGVTLVERTSPDHIVVGDARELARVVSNLLTNAISHTPAGGTVRVSTTMDADDVTLSVQDTGTGIADEDLHRIFEAGWRGTNARTPRIEGAGSGAGLGLAIARGIVEAHRGRISASNEAIGCRFDVSLPGSLPANMLSRG